eukprot:5858580-Pyramimonas_sp.AAC.2
MAKAPAPLELRAAQDKTGCGTGILVFCSRMSAWIHAEATCIGDVILNLLRHSSLRAWNPGGWRSFLDAHLEPTRGELDHETLA